MLLFQIVLATSMYWSVNSRAAYMTVVCLTIWVQGGHFTTLPTVCGYIFGDKGSMIFTILFINFGAASMTGILVVKVILTKVVGYLGVFIICAIMTGISFLLLYLLLKEELIVSNKSGVSSIEDMEYKGKPAENGKYLYSNVNNRPYFYFHSV